MKTWAKYKGKVFDASLDSETEVIIRSRDKCDLNRDFIKYDDI